MTKDEQLALLTDMRKCLLYAKQDVTKGEPDHADTWLSYVQTKLGDLREDLIR